MRSLQDVRFSVFMQRVPETQVERSAHLNVFSEKYSKEGVSYVQLNQNKVALRLLAFLRSKKSSAPNSTFDVFDDVLDLRTCQVLHVLRRKLMTSRVPVL